MATKTGSEVAPTENKAVLPAEFLQEIEADAGKGVQMGMDDIAVPYLYVLQTNSPQVNPDNDKYIQGATAGMFFNNVMEQIFDGRNEGLIVIPCAYERKYVEWRDRDTGSGGYVADWDIDSGILTKCHANAKGKPALENGNIIVETTYHYVYMLNPQTQRWEQIIIPMKSTMLKKSRRWNTELRETFIPGTSKQAPRWLYPWKLKTEKEQRDQNVWSNFNISRMPDPVTVEQYRQAKGFAELMEKGLIKRAAETMSGADVPDANDRPTTGGKGVPPRPSDLDDDIPF